VDRAVDGLGLVDHPGTEASPIATGTATAFLSAWWIRAACYVAAAGVAAWLTRR
jgi:hypothetical protein